jgi:hypothetical protein
VCTQQAAQLCQLLPAYKVTLFDELLLELAAAAAFAAVVGCQQL